MSRWHDNVQMYWPHATASILLAIPLWKYVSLGLWVEYLKSIAVAAFGFACLVASHEVADWTGQYRWTRDDFWTYPPTYVRSFGFMLLIGALLSGFY